MAQSNFIKLEDIFPEPVTIVFDLDSSYTQGLTGFDLWHQKAEADPGSSSCKRTTGRFEDGGHKDGPSEPSTTAQISSLRESSNLVLHKPGILLQSRNKDAARLENASDTTK